MIEGFFLGLQKFPTIKTYVWNYSYTTCDYNEKKSLDYTP